MQIDFSKLGIQGEVTVRDLWRQKDLGNFKNKFQADIPYHGVKFVKVTPKK